jgi:cell division protein FtsB
MRDIGARIRRYRLSRYARTDGRWASRFRWAWPVLGAWLLYIGVLSEHSMLRIWSLSRQNASAVRGLDSLKTEIARLDYELRDPKAQRVRAEHVLREQIRYARPGEIVYTIEDAPPDSLMRR